MNNKTTHTFLRGAMTLLLMLLTTATAWAWSGNGTQENPYQITSTGDLNQLATDVNGGNMYEKTYFKLMNDIAYSHSSDWNNTGSDENNFEAIGGVQKPFSGYFDGNGKTVRGIRIYRSGTDNSNKLKGLFGYIGEGGSVHDLTLSDAHITAYLSTGGLVGYNEGSVTNCHVTNNVMVRSIQSNSYSHGGIAGDNGGAVTNCSSAVTISIAGSASLNYGGIAGYNTGTLTGNLAIGATVPSAQDNRHGAICGYNDGGTLERNYYTGCTVAGQTTGAGCQNADVTDNDGAVPASTVFSQDDNTYTILNADGWNVFCNLLAGTAKGYFTGKTILLDKDISVTRMASASYHDFTGTFDGGGHTLTVNYTATGEYCAPFRYVESGCTIRNLRVGGTINTSSKYAAGLIGSQYGSVSIENCRVSVTINSSIDGDGTHGGIVVLNGEGSNLTIEGCVFDGKLLGSTTTYCGGFVGRRAGAAAIYNSLFAPSEVSMGSAGSATFVRNGSAGANCYYTQTLGEAQGKARHSVTAGENVTIARVDVVTEYDVSGITAYSGGGLKCGDNLYAGSNDQVSLTLSHPEGYDFHGYSASAGTLDGTENPYTLTMPDGDVTVNASLSVLDWTGKGTAEDPYMIYNKDQLNLLAYRVNGTHDETLQSDGFDDKYFRLGADITYTGGSDTESNYEAIGDFYHNFCGDFDGAGHTISGIRIYKEDNNYADRYQGLFGRTSGDANIHGIRLADTRITGNDYTGGIVGENNGTITDCHVANDVCIHAVQASANAHGGIVGNNIAGIFEGYTSAGIIEGCTSAATLSGTECHNYGAIAGRNVGGTLRANLAICATIPAATYNSHGAICGYNDGGTLERNYYTACTVAGEPNATGVGCGYILDSTGFISADVTTDDGAVPGIILYDHSSWTDINSYIFTTVGNVAVPRLALQGRTLYKDGDWNTLCLPFDIDDFDDTIFDDATVMELDTEGTYEGHQTGYDAKTGTLSLYFKETDEIKAGVPYLVKWESAANIVNPVFEGVTVSNEINSVTSEDGNVTFIGNYSPVVLPGNDASNLYLGTENKLYWPSQPRTINAFRGYFNVDLSNGAYVREIRMSIDSTTSVESVPGFKIQVSGSDGATYNLSGQKVSDDYKGIVIKNGRKYVKE